MSQDDPGGPPAFEARGVSRSFGSLRALHEVDFDLRPGEIHALVGENGAGKSTLAKLMSGSLAADAGSMTLFGEPYEPEDRRAGAALGVAHVRQQLSLVRGLTVAQNLQLGRPGAGFVFDDRSARAEVDRLAVELGLAVPTDALVDDLPLATRQQAEILIAVAWGARLLILDEPSSALGPIETDALIELCLRLRSEGTPIVYISHRLPELVRLADRLTVLRRGEVVVSGADVGDADLNEVAGLMVGDLSLLEVTRPSTKVGEVRLRAEGLRVVVEHGVGIEEVDLEVRGGEVVGVVGVAGSGQDPLVEALTGQVHPDRGTVEIDGHDVTGSPARSLAAGVAHLHEDRATGLAHGFTVADNLSIRGRRAPSSLKRGMRWLGPLSDRARTLAERFHVRPPIPDAIAGSLSGGNQQKLMAARELERTPSVLIAHGPTKGLDPHAAKVMRDRCFAVAEQGGAVLVVSADLDEVRDLASRVLVLSAGRITDAMSIGDMTSDRLGRAMAGLTVGETP